MDIQKFTREMLKEAGLGTALLTTLSRAGGKRSLRQTAKTIGQQIYGAGKKYIAQAGKGYGQMSRAGRSLLRNKSQGAGRERAIRHIYRGAKKMSPVVGTGALAGYGAYKSVY